MSQGTTTCETTLDLNGALGNLDGDVELLQEVMQIFLEMAPAQLTSLENGIAAGDALAVAVQAHGMKGGASNFCASRFVEAALALEKLAKQGELDGAEDLLAHMREAFAELSEVAAAINWDELARSYQG